MVAHPPPTLHYLNSCESREGLVRTKYAERAVFGLIFSLGG